LLGARRGGAPERPDRGAEGSPQARRAHGRRRPHERHDHRHDRRGARRGPRQLAARRHRSQLMSHDATSRASALTALPRRPYSWAIMAIALRLAANPVTDPGYLATSYSESTGNLAGNLIDILRAAAPIAMIAVGMCLVIAPAGIDLSVGSLMAVAGAVAME